ncbi:MAG: hypothetical protein WC648_01060 [Candidatus Paceibacterota bacterium]
MNKIYIREQQKHFFFERKVHKALDIISLTMLVGMVIVAYF